MLVLMLESNQAYMHPSVAASGLLEKHMVGILCQLLMLHVRRSCVGQRCFLVRNMSYIAGRYANLCTKHLPFRSFGIFHISELSGANSSKVKRAAA